MLEAQKRKTTEGEVMSNYTTPTDPDLVREWEEDPDYVEATTDEKKIDEGMASMTVDAVLAGIRFIHDYAETPGGDAEIDAAIEAGFFHILPSEGDNNNVYALPHLLLPDAFYHKLCPGRSFGVSFGIQIDRYMLWGPPSMIERRPTNDRTGRVIHEALRRFKRERERPLCGHLSGLSRLTACAANVVAGKD
jgi:hypothetical protein